ncbi:hypothetical protein [Kitasatospora sp. NPDC059673]|uniref:hypothetical protein n=1 Tax=Kitasatospora sp. NPDC059673 TaxID=3346901 RepID=UPI0036B6B3B1
MSEKSEKFETPEVVCGIYDKAPANSDDVLAHTAEMHEGAEVLCGIYDKSLES